ncbi:hypothetical protein HS121_02010 [bacterium]|nr:hypothetical protein [bacterium]
MLLPICSTTILSHNLPVMPGPETLPTEEAAGDRSGPSRVRRSINPILPERQIIRSLKKLSQPERDGTIHIQRTAASGSLFSLSLVPTVP